MADSELLELAAKAAKPFLTPETMREVLGFDWDDTDKPLFTEYGAVGTWYWVGEDGKPAGTERKGWNPLTDDGDALRLAVKLRLIIDPVVKPLDGSYPCAAILIPGGFDYITESFGADPYAATRRAIVRAAAEIGKAMP
jgi:hypothetical protein